MNNTCNDVNRDWNIHDNDVTIDRHQDKVTIYLLHMQRLLMHVTRLYYKWFEPPFGDSVDMTSHMHNWQEFKLFPCIPTLIFQIKFYSINCSLHLSLEWQQNAEWFDALCKFYEQFSRNYFDNSKYKRNDYDEYVNKYFYSSHFDISFYLFVLLEYIICVFADNHNIGIDYFSAINVEKCSTIDVVRKIHKNNFHHCISAKFILFKGYNIMRPFKKMNPLYSALAPHVGNIDCMILYKKENSSTASLVRSRFRVTVARSLNNLLHYMKKESDDHKSVKYKLSYHLQLFNGYHKLFTFSLSFMPIDKLCNYNQIYNYVERFVLRPALKCQKHHNYLLSKGRFPVGDHGPFIERALNVKEIIWCYFLVGDDEKCKQYFKIYQFCVKQQASMLHKQYNIPCCIEISEDDDNTQDLFDLLHDNRENSTIATQSNTSRKQRMTLFKKHVIDVSQSCYQKWKKLVKIDSQQFNLVENVLMKDITDSNYIGWRNLALEKQCQWCRKKNEQLKKCKRCKRVCYCSILCQKQHWVRGHRSECNKNVCD